MTTAPTDSESTQTANAVGLSPSPRYAAFYDNQSRLIYLRTPQREQGYCDHGIDHATALRLRDELNDALLMRPHKQCRPEKT